MSERGKPCPCCDVENLADPNTVLAFGVALGATICSEPSKLATMCCDKHRTKIVMAQMRAIIFIQDSGETAYGAT